MASSTLRFGQGATSEVGMDFSNMIAELPASERANAKIAIFTDKTVAKLPVMRVVEESLLKEGLNWVMWDKCSVEPTDKSWQVSRAVLATIQNAPRVLTVRKLSIGPEARTLRTSSL